MSDKIYSVEADMNAPWTNAVNNRDALGKSLYKLSTVMNEAVRFHDYATPMCGAPVVLIECSDKFIAAARNLPEYRSHRELDAATKTAPSQQIQQYFSKP